MKKLNVTIWNEDRQHSDEIAKVHPRGIHQTIADFLAKDPALKITTARLDDPEQGLSAAVLDATDVLIWWAHMAHNDLSDYNSRRVQKRVLEGMGFIVLHSAMWAKPFAALLGTSCQCNYRMVFERELVWVVDPGHPIASGLETGFAIEHEEIYSEHFDVPPPDELVFISSFTGGEVFRSGCCWKRGAGRIFYFRPGHETLPTYNQPEVQRVILNAVHWAAPRARLAFEAGPKLGPGLTPPPRPDGKRILGGSHPMGDVLGDECYHR